MVAKAVIALVFCGVVTAVCLGQSVLARSVREGVSNALSYDFEMGGVVEAIGNLFGEQDPSIPIENKGGVEYYESPVNGTVIQGFSEQTPYTEFSCPLFLRVKAMSNGKITAVETQDAGYKITLTNSFGVIICYESTDSIMVSVGDTVTAGQIIGGLSTEGKLRITLTRNGQPEDCVGYFE